MTATTDVDDRNAADLDESDDADVDAANESTAPKTSEMYWYVLAAYLVALGLGVTGFLALVAATSKISLIAVGAVVIVTALVLASLPTFPALYKDTKYLDEAADWDPSWWLYVGGGAGSPIAGFVVGGFALGLRVNLALSTLSWLGSVAGMCILYLYRRHKFVGVP